MPRKTQKRVSLVEAARILIHKQGFNLTTLADIAEEAGVPLGNVYYYFKTKEAIGEAVIEKRAAEYAEHLARFGEIQSPADRLVALLTHTEEELDLLARYGCAIGGLCQELGKQGGSLADQAAKLLHDILKWIEKQFITLGFAPEKAESFALSYLASIQGLYLLVNTFKDPQLLLRQSVYLKSWLNDIFDSVGAKISSDTSSEESAYV